MGARLSVIVLGLVLTIYPGLVVAQDCLEPIGRWPYGVSNSVVAEGNLAVLGNGAAVQVLDLTTPSAPTVIGDVSVPTEVRAVAIAGQKVFATTWNSFHVISLDGPAPVEMGALSGLGGEELEVEGNHAYLLGYRRLSIVDVSAPAEPTLVGELVWSDGNPRDLRVVGGHAIIADQDADLRVVDVSDPTTPEEIAVLDFGVGNRPSRLDVADGFAYVAGYGDSDFDHRLFVVDLSDPAHPTVVASPTVGGAYDIVVRQGVATIANSWSLYTYDVTEPLTITLLGSVSGPSFPVSDSQRLAAVDGHALMAGPSSGLTVFDVLDPSAPAVAATVPVPGLVHDAAFADGALFIAADYDGLRVVEVGDPFQPVELGATVAMAWAFGVAVKAEMAYLSGSGFVAIDVSDPAAPVVLGSAPGVYGLWLALAGDLAFAVYDSSGSVRVADISSPGAPVLVGTLELRPGRWEWPVVIGDHLILRNNDNLSSVVVVDAGDPTAPVQVAEIDVSASIGGLAVTGSWLLVPDIPDGHEPAIRVFDMRDPAVPVEVAPYHPVGGAVEAVGVAGSVAYLAVMDFPPIQSGGIEVVNFARPQAPVFMGLLPRPGRVKRFAFGPDEVYVFGERTGFDTYALCQGLIFADGFETGDTTAWSSVVP